MIRPLMVNTRPVSSIFVGIFVICLMYVTAPAGVDGLAFAQESAAAAADSQGIDLRVHVHTGLPLLVEIDRMANATVKVDLPVGKDVTRKIRVREEIDFIDEYTEYGDAGWKADRHFLKYFVNDNDANRDKEVTGLTFTYTYDGNEYFLDTGESRSINVDSFNRLLDQENSLGIWLPFPDSAKPGDEFAVDFYSLATLLIDTDGEIVVTDGKFVLDSVDAEENTALLKGTVEFVETREENRLSLRSEFALESKIVIDLANRIISAIEMKGGATISGGNNAVKASGKANVSIDLSVRSGEAVEKARQKKPKFRDVVWKLANRGVELVLPSHWYQFDDEDEVLFQSTRNRDGDERYLAVMTMPSEGAPFGEVSQVVENGLRETVGQLKAGTVRSRLGKGCSFRFSNEGHDFIFELYPLGKSHFLRIRLYGRGEGFGEGIKELKIVRKSLKSLIK